MSYVDQEYCTPRDFVRWWLWVGPRHPDRRQYRLVCVFLVDFRTKLTICLCSGQIAKMSTATTSSLTTLQREILRFVVIIAALATLVAVIVVILWATWLRKDHPDYINVPTLLIDVVSVMVAFIPEGLPIAVTISLAKVAHTLSRHKVLCKCVVYALCKNAFINAS